MSDLYVRQYCDALAKSLSPDYVNTINEEQNPDPTGNWWTLEYQALLKARDTFCSVQESGNVSLVFFGVAGVGYEALQEYAAPIVEAFVASVDPNGRLTLELDQPPSDFTALDSPSYVLEYAINYAFRKGV